MFSLKTNGTTFKQELLAGLTTFSTMAYVMVVNPLILSEAGMDFQSAMIASILCSVLATFIMAFGANYPFVLAPGIGMSAYFTYSVVLGEGLPWQTALGIVFLTGLILLILWMTGWREKIIHAIPKALKIGATGGVGLFLVVIGLKGAGIIVSHPQTLLTLGDIKSPTVMLSGLGIIITAALMTWRVQGAFLIALFANWLLGLILGLVAWKGFFAWPSFNLQTFMALDIKNALAPDVWMVIFSFLFICLFDTTGSMMGLAQQGGFLDKEGKLPRLKKTLLPDTIGTITGGLLGTSASVIYLESASGVAAGGRTGLTALVAGLFFLASLFFEPLASSIPIFAVTPILVIIGALMLSSVRNIDWEDPSEFIPAFVAVVGIPLTYSIGTGIGLGMILYPLIKLLSGKLRDVHWLAWVLAALFIAKFTIS